MSISRQLLASVALLAISGSTLAEIANIEGGSSDLFVSIVERNSNRQVVRNLLVDTNLASLDLVNNEAFWTTSPEQESEIRAFLSSSSGTVLLNVGGKLGGELLSDDAATYGIVSSGEPQGRLSGSGNAAQGFAATNSARVNLEVFINNANQGVFSDAGTLLATGPAFPGWHDIGEWGDNLGGASGDSTEILFGTSSVLQQYRLDLDLEEMVSIGAGPVASDLSTGRITIGVVPIPGALLLFGSGLIALLGLGKSRLKLRIASDQ